MTQKNVPSAHELSIEERKRLRGSKERKHKACARERGQSAESKRKGVDQPLRSPALGSCHVLQLATPVAFAQTATTDPSSEHHQTWPVTSFAQASLLPQRST